MIKVCDAIMGSGKTEAAIRFINENPERKFIYAAPYLEEADRIRKGCPGADLREPVPLWKYKRSKVGHSADMLTKGMNITTTHQALSMYTQEMIEDIRSQHYTLIIDEAINILTPVECSEDDINILERAGYVKKVSDNSYTLIEDNYKGELLQGVFKVLRHRDIVMFNDNAGRPATYYWAFPVDVLEAFEDVYVLTYMFDGQMMKYYLDYIGLGYKMIGITKSGENEFRFCEDKPVDYIPEYVANLENKIHIDTTKSINNIGDKNERRCSLSMNWFMKSLTNKHIIKNNLYNYFRNIQKAKSKDVMWGTFSTMESYLRGLGYTKSFVVFNERSKNCYSSRTILAYCCNVFMNTSQKIFLDANGGHPEEDKYALSTMIQWIWRSAIRNGEDIYIYIPSERMRQLLIDWIQEVASKARAHQEEVENENKSGRLSNGDRKNASGVSVHKRAPGKTVHLHRTIPVGSDSGT